MKRTDSHETDFSGKRVTVVGLGIEGVDLVRFLVRKGARVTVSDSKPLERLTSSLERIDGLPVTLSVGRNDPAIITDAEAVFVSQGVPLDMPALVEVRNKGIPLHSMLSLFMTLCPGPIAGITGSSGKTTTTALTGEMFRADGRPVFVGGNIGVGLLEALPDIGPSTWCVLEISHTQIQLLECSPHVGAVLNVTPNHLDRFSWNDYRELKARLIRYQRPEDTAILGFDDVEAKVMAGSVRGRLVWFSLGNDIPGDGVLLEDGWAVLQTGNARERLFPVSSLRIRGRHNCSNALAAAAVASACGVSPTGIALAAASFTGVPHRLELVGEVKGVRYYNDSIATTPERTMAGMRSFTEPLVLLLGGRDKRLPLEDLIDECARRCRAIVFFGESGEKLESVFHEDLPEGVVTVRVPGMREAVAQASALSRPGDLVLLSPACTSFDAYDNFERRGEQFRDLVYQLQKEVSPSLE